MDLNNKTIKDLFYRHIKELTLREQDRRIRRRPMLGYWGCVKCSTS